MSAGRDALAVVMHDAVCDCNRDSHDDGMWAQWKDQADAVLAHQQPLVNAKREPLAETRQAVRREVGTKPGGWQPMVTATEVQTLLDALDHQESVEDGPHYTRQDHRDLTESLLRYSDEISGNDDHALVVAVQALTHAALALSATDAADSRAPAERRIATALTEHAECHTVSSVTADNVRFPCGYTYTFFANAAYGDAVACHDAHVAAEAAAGDTQ